MFCWLILPVTSNVTIYKYLLDYTDNTLDKNYTFFFTTVASSEIDSDNDGTPDTEDAFPTDPNETTDTDASEAGDQ